MSEPYALREATAADAGTLANTVFEGYSTYAEFAPDGWAPPAADAAEYERHLAGEGYWCLLAEDGAGAPAGHTAFMPAGRHPRLKDPDPEVCHLFQLFVRRPHWGSGLAARLHEEALSEAGSRGYTTMRLFTPSGQARARRFYEREGWSAVADRGMEPTLGLEITEYRRPV